MKVVDFSAEGLPNTLKLEDSPYYQNRRRRLPQRPQRGRKSPRMGLPTSTSTKPNGFRTHWPRGQLAIGEVPISLETNSTKYLNGLPGVARNNNGRWDNFACMERVTPDRPIELLEQPKDCANYVVLRFRDALRGERSVSKDWSPLPSLQFDNEVSTDPTKGASACT